MARKPEAAKAVETQTTAAPAENSLAPEIETPAVDLVAIATELNSVMGLDPAIDTTLEPEALLARIAAESAQIVVEDEKDIQPATWAWLTDSGYLKHLVPPVKPANTSAADKAAAKAAEKAAKDKEKADAKAAKDAEKAAKAAEKAAGKPAVAPKYTRPDAFAEAIASGANTAETIVAKSNELYVANGGTDNVKEAQWLFGYAIKILTSMKHISLVDGKYVVTVVPK